MIIQNAQVGKPGFYIIGPKYFLNQDIRFGEIALCIGEDVKMREKPKIWVFGGIDRISAYLTLTYSEGELPKERYDLLSEKISEVRAAVPKTALQRLSHASNLTIEELQEYLRLAQVAISAPVEGVLDYSTASPKWLPRSKTV